MNIDSLVADRLGGEEFFKKESIYRFTKIKNILKDIDDKDKPLIDFGIGESDEITSYKVIDRLYSEALKKENSDIKTEMKKTKELNFTLARSVKASEPAKSAEDILHEMFT